MFEHSVLYSWVVDVWGSTDLEKCVQSVTQWDTLYPLSEAPVHKWYLIHDYWNRKNGGETFNLGESVDDFMLIFGIRPEDHRWESLLVNRVGEALRLEAEAMMPLVTRPFFALHTIQEVAAIKLYPGGSREDCQCAARLRVFEGGRKLWPEMLQQILSRGLVQVPIRICYHVEGTIQAKHSRDTTMPCWHGTTNCLNHDALPFRSHAVLDEKLGLRSHAKQDVVVVIAALDLVDPLADLVRPREVKRSALDGEHLARGDLSGVNGGEVVRAVKGKEVVQDAAARMAREVEVGMLSYVDCMH